MSIHQYKLISLFDNHELRNNFNKMITKLDLSCYQNNLLSNSDDLKLLCEIFSNTEQLTCKTNQRASVLLMMKHWPQLSHLNVFLGAHVFVWSIPSREKQMHKLGVRMFADFQRENSKSLSLRLSREKY